MTTYPLQQLLPAAIVSGVTLFARIGSAIGLLPGFGETYVPLRVRLAMALGVTLVLAPVLAPTLPPAPASLPGIVLLLSGEIFIGLFLGLATRILLAGLETGGAIIAMQSSLASALVFNPGAPEPQTLPAGLFGALAVVLIFATGTEGMLLQAVAQSYTAFPAGGVPPFDDISKAIVETASRSFLISVELAAPYLVAGTLFYVVLGLASRIMPQLQIFFLAMPAQLVGGLAMLAILLSGSMLWFLDRFRDAVSALAHPA